MFKVKSLVLAFVLSVFGAEAHAATAVGVADTGNYMGGQSVSALFSNNDDWIQAKMNIRGVSGAFQFAVGGTYKFTVAGNSRAGFHIGPGIALGTSAANGSNDFAFAIVGEFGAHYTLFERLVLSFDAGPIVSINDGDVDFRVQPMGGLLGLGVHYLF